MFGQQFITHKMCFYFEWGPPVVLFLTI